MRVPTVDYSPLQNAISNKYGASSGKYISGGLNIASQGINLANKSMNIAKRSSELSAERIEVNKAYNDKMTELSKWGIVVGAVEGLLKTGISHAYNATHSAQGTEANNTLLDVAAAADGVLQKSIGAGNTYISENSGSIVYGDDVKSFFSGEIAGAKDKGWMSDITGGYINKIKEMEQSLDTKALSYINSKSNSDLSKAFTESLSKAQQIDASAGNREGFIRGDIPYEQMYGAGISAYQAQYTNGGLNAVQLKYGMQKYQHDTDMAMAQNILSDMARNGGSIQLSDGTTVNRDQFAQTLKTRYGLSEDDINDLQKIADTSEKNYIDNELIPSSEKRIDDCYATKGTDAQIAPSKAIESMIDEMKLNGQNANHITKAVKAAQAQHLAKANEELNSKLFSLNTNDIAAVVSMRDELITNKDWYASGAETAYNTAYDKLTDTINAYQEGLADVVKQAGQMDIDLVKGREKLYSAVAEQCISGVTSGYDGIGTIVAQLPDIDPVKMAEYSVTNPDYYNALISENKAGLSAIDKIYNNAVPEEFKSLVKTNIDSAQEILAKFYGDENIAGIDEATRYLNGAIIDLCLETKKEKITSKDIQDRFDDIKAIFTNKAKKALLDNRTDIKEPAQKALAAYNTFTAYSVAYTKNETINGKSELCWSDAEYKEAFENAAKQLGGEVNRALKTESIVPTITTEKVGSLERPIILFKNEANGEVYKLDQEGNIKFANDFISVKDADGKVVTMLNDGRILGRIGGNTISTLPTLDNSTLPTPATPATKDVESAITIWEKETGNKVVRDNNGLLSWDSANDDFRAWYANGQKTGNATSATSEETTPATPATPEETTPATPANPVEVVDTIQLSPMVVQPAPVATEPIFTIEAIAKTDTWIKNKIAGFNDLTITKTDEAGNTIETLVENGKTVQKQPPKTEESKPKVEEKPVTDNKGNATGATTTTPQSTLATAKKGTGGNTVSVTQKPEQPPKTEQAQTTPTIGFKQISKEEYEKGSGQSSNKKGFIETKSPDEEKLIEDLKNNLNSKKFNNKKNALIDYYVKNKNYSKDKAKQVVESLISDMRK